VGLAALRFRGFRPDSRGGHHVMIIQTLSKTVGYPKENIRMFDEFRRQRAISLYDGSFDPTDAELDALLEAAGDLKRHLDDWIVGNQA